MNPPHAPPHWRLQKQRYRMIGSHCQECGSPLFPPRHYCESCRNAFTKAIHITVSSMFPIWQLQVRRFQEIHP